MKTNNTASLNDMTIKTMSELPRGQLNLMIARQAGTYNPDVRVLIAAQYRIIDLEYKLQEMEEKLAFYQREYEASQNPAGDTFDGEFTEVRG